MIDRWLNAQFVKRYHTSNVASQTVADHTFGVMCIICALVDEPSANLLKAALLHDTSEDYLGDIPAPVKRDFPEVKQLLTEIESIIDTGYNEIPITAEEKTILKIADWMEGVIYTNNQFKMGNRYAKVIRNNFIRYLYDMDWDGLDSKTRERAFVMLGKYDGEEAE